MPTNTPNLNLIKPLVTENYDITKVTNDNADIIDDAIHDLDLDKQDKLVSGTNIKTVNGNSVLGSGNLVIPTGSTYTVYTATIPSSSWTGSSAPFSKVVNVTGILATDYPNYDVIASGTYATDITRKTEWAKIYRWETTTDTITFYATSVPTVDLPLAIKVVR